MKIIGLKLNLRLAKYLFEKQYYATLKKTLDQLHLFCKNQNKSNTTDLTRTNRLLDVYHYVVLVALEERDHPLAARICEAALLLELPGTPNSKLAIFNFVKGKISLKNQEYDLAQTKLWDAFKSFDDMKYKTTCVTYMLLRDMLAGSQFNALNEVEIKVLQNDRAVKPWVELLTHYQAKNIRRFNNACLKFEQQLKKDAYAFELIGNAAELLCLQIIEEEVSPYTRVSLNHISKLIARNVDVTQKLVIQLILDKKIRGVIDEINGTLILHGTQLEAKKYSAVANWTNALGLLNDQMTTRISVY